MLVWLIIIVGGVGVGEGNSFDLLICPQKIQNCITSAGMRQGCVFSGLISQLPAWFGSSWGGAGLEVSQAVGTSLYGSFGEAVAWRATRRDVSAFRSCLRAGACLPGLVELRLNNSTMASVRWVESHAERSQYISHPLVSVSALCWLLGVFFGKACSAMPPSPRSLALEN